MVWMSAEPCAGALSEYAHGQPGSQCGSKLLASAQIVAADHLGRKDCLRRLGMRANDDRLGNRPQPPPRRNPRNLPGRVLAVAAGTDQDRIWAAVDALQRGVVR